MSTRLRACRSIPALAASLKEQFGEGYKASYRLHPPILRAMGMKKKISLGAWFKPFFVVLYFMRRLRHTPLDVFGYAGVRRLERSLLAEYEEVLDELTTTLEPSSVDRAAEIAALPDMVRGYEHIKERNAEAYRERLAELRSAPASPATASVGR